jgi:hypothetical protein
MKVQMKKQECICTTLGTGEIRELYIMSWVRFRLKVRIGWSDMRRCTPDETKRCLGETDPEQKRFPRSGEAKAKHR